MSIFGFILAFLPWILFLILSGHSLPSLKIAIIISFFVSIGMGIARIHRGAILWAGVCFFSFDIISVVLLNNRWIAMHTGALASGTLFAAALLSLLVGKPFTMEYARSTVEEKYWKTPEFLRSCNIITAGWCVVFLLNVILSIVKLYYRGVPGWVYEVTQYAFLFSGVAFTNFYSKHERKKREGKAPDQSKLEEAPGKSEE